MIGREKPLLGAFYDDEEKKRGIDMSFPRKYNKSHITSGDGGRRGGLEDGGENGNAPQVDPWRWLDSLSS